MLLEMTRVIVSVAETGKDISCYCWPVVFFSQTFPLPTTSATVTYEKKSGALKRVGKDCGFLIKMREKAEFVSKLTTFYVTIIVCGPDLKKLKNILKTLQLS